MTKTIHSKLLDFQRLNISIVKDGTNPHFKSKYATLNEVLDKVKKPLNDMGVLILFQPEADGLRTILMDLESNTSVESFMKHVGIGNAQSVLSCNTYYRRSSLVALLGLEDEDDDGNKASVVIPKVEPNQNLIDEVKKIDSVEDYEVFRAKHISIITKDKGLQTICGLKLQELKAKQ